MQNSMAQTTLALFVTKFKIVVGREPSPAEVRGGKDLEPADMMNAILDAKLADGKAHE